LRIDLDNAEDIDGKLHVGEGTKTPC
jgi:hypothetical protein